MSDYRLVQAFIISAVLPQARKLPDATGIRQGISLMIDTIDMTYQTYKRNDELESRGDYALTGRARLERFGLIEQKSAKTLIKRKELREKKRARSEMVEATEGESAKRKKCAADEASSSRASEAREEEE